MPVRWGPGGAPLNSRGSVQAFTPTGQNKNLLPGSEVPHLSAPRAQHLWPCPPGPHTGRWDERSHLLSEMPLSTWSLCTFYLFPDSFPIHLRKRSKQPLAVRWTPDTAGEFNRTEQDKALWRRSYCLGSNLGDGVCHTANRHISFNEKTGKNKEYAICCKTKKVTLNRMRHISYQVTQTNRHTLGYHPAGRLTHSVWKTGKIQVNNYRFLASLEKSKKSNNGPHFGILTWKKKTNRTLGLSAGCLWRLGVRFISLPQAHPSLPHYQVTWAHLGPAP